MENKGNTTYAYDTMTKLVQYSTASTEYSPNNIRRIIISPDAIYMLKHLQVGAGRHEYMPIGKYNSVRIEMNRYAACVQSGEGKSMMLALIERVPRLIEEIVVCTKGKANAQLLPSDSDMTQLLSGYTGNRAANTEDTIKHRFQRLASYIVFNGTIDMFMQGIAQEQNEKADFLLCKSEFVKKAQASSMCKVYKLNEEWYNAVVGLPYRVDAMGKEVGYKLDVGNGVLHNHMLKVKKHMETALKKQSVDKFTKERLFAEKDTFEKEYDKAKAFIKLVEDFIRLKQKVGVLPFCETVPMFNLGVKTLKPSKYIDKASLPNAFTLEEPEKDATINEKESLAYNTAVVKNMRTSLYMEVVGMMLDVLLKYQSMGAGVDATKNFLQQFDRRVMMPPQLESKNAMLAYQFQGAKLDVGLTNALTLLSLLYLNANDKQNREAWA